MRNLPALLLLCVLPLAAQTDRASLNGTITDPSGSVVPGVVVQVDSTQTGLHREAVTSGAGMYQLSGLPIGGYKVTMLKDGFKPFALEGLALLVNEARVFNAQLEVGTSAQAVTVNALNEGMNTTTPEVGGVVQAQQIRDLPISGRNWATLMLLVPGAINYSDGAQRGIRFSGHSLDDSNFTFDGIETSGIQEQTQKADTRLNIALDSIAEFRVSQGVYSAENGGAGGAQIQVVSKGGTNEFHGRTFYLARNAALDARSPFDPEELPHFTLNQFGGGLGGPIVKDKAFFFANYEGLRQSLGQTLIGFVPNAAFRSQVLAKSPSLKPLISAFPTGQTPVDEITDQITVQGDNTVREDAGLFRLDYRFNDKYSAFLRYNIDNAYIDNPTDAIGSHNVIPHIPQNLALQLQQIFTPRTMNEVRFGMNRADYRNHNYGTSPLDVSPGPFDGLTGNSLDTEVGTSFSFIDNVTLTRGRNTFKMGFDIRRIRLNNSGNTITTSSIGYDTADDFINNVASSATLLQGEGIVGQRRTFWMGYAQDDLKLTPTLSLYLGMRYEFYSVVREIHDRGAVVDIAACGGFCPKGTPFYAPDKNNWGPRLGFAWSPAVAHGKTNVRGGYGIYYGANQNDDFSDPMESAVPRYSLKSSDFPSLSYPLDAFLDPKNQLFSPKAIDRNRRDLYYQKWDFLVQQQLPADFVLQLGYVGGAGHHLFNRSTINTINPATGTRPLSNFSSFGLKSNLGNNNFNALQASVQRRFVRGLLLQGNYMWSHGITDSSIGAGESVTYQNMNCRACDRSSSNIDVRHTGVINAVYQLPFGSGRQWLHGRGLGSALLGGWDLAGIFAANSGQPVNITITRKASTLLDGNTSAQRPDLVPGVPIYSTDQTVDHWFNKSAFQLPAKGTWGNLGRYIARGPNSFELDSSLEKTIRLREHLGLDFRASGYNLLNHPVYSNPSGNVASSSFGRITSVRNTGAVGLGAPRRFEFMVRLEF